MVSCSAPWPGASGLNWTGFWYRWRLAEVASSPPALDPPLQPTSRARAAPNAIAAAAVRDRIIAPRHRRVGPACTGWCGQAGLRLRDMRLVVVGRHDGRAQRAEPLDLGDHHVAGGEEAAGGGRSEE